MIVELRTDVLIIGGGTGGVAAALAVARAGQTCILAEPLRWVGGQLTAQAVPPDEHRWIEEPGPARGCTALYAAFRESVRRWYREHRPLTPAAANNPRLNPGGGWVSRLCAEPRIMHDVLLGMLAPHRASGKVDLITGVTLASLAAEGDRVGPATLIDIRSGAEITVHASYYLDATELGDTYGLAGVEHAIGADAASTFGEMHAPAEADPLDQQAFSWCFAIEHRPGESHVLPKPAAYDFWRSFVPTMAPGQAEWTGPLFSWTVPSHNQAGRRTFPFIPWPESCSPHCWEMWRYRRIVDASIYRTPEAFAYPDVCLVNWVQMDYWLRPLLGVAGADAAKALAEAREQSLCLLYWMQTEAPHLDADGQATGRVGYPGLRLVAGEAGVMGTADGLAMAPYIREPRRLLARTIVTEAHIGTEQRRAEGRPRMDPAHGTDFGTAEPFADSVGVGHYMIDLHPSCSGRNSVYVPAAPFRIPMGSLIPRRVRNLLAAGKGIGVTHVTNGCYRMHHTEWNIGESAGALAAWCCATGREPHAVHESATLTAEFQRELERWGVVMKWPWES